MIKSNISEKEFLEYLESDYVKNERKILELKNGPISDDDWKKRVRCFLDLGHHISKCTGAVG